MRNKVVRVPQVMQMEVLECGAACLGMILAYYGRWVSLEALRCDCGISRDGSKATNILRAARSYGLVAKGMSYSITALREKGTYPCILFWDFSHFVVLRGFRGKYAYLNDPARGQVRVPMEEFERKFTGVALTFAKTDAFEPGGERISHLDFLKSGLSTMKPAIALVMLCAAVISLLTIINTSMSRVFIDRILTEGHRQWLAPFAIIMLLVVSMMSIIGVIKDVYFVRIQGKVAVVSSSRFMRHLLHLPLDFYEQHMIGDLQQRQWTNETIVATLIGQLGPVFINLIMLVLYLVIMLQNSVALTLVGLLTVCINAVVARMISVQRVNVSRSMVSDAGKLYVATVTGVDMIETIKSAGAEIGFFQRWAGYQADYADAYARMTYINEHLGAIPALVSSLGNAGVLLLGVWLILTKGFTPGALLAFQGLLGCFMAPVMGLIELGQSLQELETHVERISDVMECECDTPEDYVDDGEAARQFGREKLRGQVDLKGVTFGYSPLDPPLIEDFDLHLEPGQWVALVGESGCGKTTIARLIAGLFKPWSGEICFDGVSADEVPLSVRHSSLAMVNQDIVTFDDTIGENIKLWDATIDDRDVTIACRDASIHETILEREGGYSNRILPGGRNFSGGELQRIEIARTLAQDPTVLVLDEATSALDAKCEAEVISHIRDREVTCIVVAHRLSTVRDCDEIIVLDDGKVVERGTHDELLALDGRYAQLVRDE